MTKFSCHFFKSFVLSFALLTVASLSSCQQPVKQANTFPTSTSTDKVYGHANSNTTNSATSANYSNFLGSVFGPSFLSPTSLVSGATGLIAIIALFLAIKSFLKANKSIREFKQANELLSELQQIRSTVEMHDSRLNALILQQTSQQVRLNTVADNLQKESTNLLTRLRVHEDQVRAHGSPHADQLFVNEQSSSVPPATPSSHPPLNELVSLATQSNPSFVISAPDAVRQFAQVGPTKSDLIDAVNSGNRQQLKMAAMAELNITSAYEAALFSGRSLTAELEEVTAGGSYWLVELAGMHWLFPTDKTLRGIVESGQDKGMYILEKQTVAQNQLIEPARLQRSGRTWTLSTTGLIAVP